MICIDISELFLSSTVRFFPISLQEDQHYWSSYRDRDIISLSNSRITARNHFRGASKMITLAYFLVWFSLSNNAAEAIIGINWGRNTAQRLVPSQVVDLILQNGISSCRVYSAQDDILNAFAGSGIKLNVGIFQVTTLKDTDKATKWLDQRGPAFNRANVSRIIFGNQIFNQAVPGTKYDMYNPNDMSIVAVSLRIFETVSKVLRNSEYQNIQLTTAHDTQFILKKNIRKPSDAEFEDFLVEPMIQLVRMLRENNAPFMIEVFPISRVIQRHFDPSFAFPDNKSTTVIKDVNGAVYTNYIEFEHDAILWALEKINASDLHIVFSMVGWPTDGFPGANIRSAERFYKSFLPLVLSGRGTPKRPGVRIEAFLHALTDENRTPSYLATMRHWGIYRSNGEPKFKIDFSGQGRDVYPVVARGINRMPERWCVFNGDMTKVYLVNFWVNQACKLSDCTASLPGGSCSNLTFSQNASYAFNMYFQSYFQDESACDFGGLGKVVYEDPSVGNCVFPVEVVRGLQDDFSNYFLAFKPPPMAKPPPAANGGERTRDIVGIGLCAIYVFLLSHVLSVVLALY